MGFEPTYLSAVDFKSTVSAIPPRELSLQGSSMNYLERDPLDRIWIPIKLSQVMPAEKQGTR